LPVLATVLDTCLRLLHPFMPFVTEAVWQRLREHLAWAEADALVVAPWPKAQRKWTDREAEERMAVVMDVVRAIRNIRADRQVDPARYVEAYVAADGARPVLEAARAILESLARVRPLHLIADAAEAPKSGVASTVLAQAQVVVPLAGLIDLGAERARLSKQLAKAEEDAGRIDKKLANAAFREKAPAAVVAKEEEKLAAARARLEGLRQRLAELE
jgi:valyl-tRNA synthetase